MAPDDIEDRESDNRLLEHMYASHHRREQAGGQRLGQAFLEKPRARLFRAWIGRDKDVLDLGCRDGLLTRHFTDGNRVNAMGSAEVVDLNEEPQGRAETDGDRVLLSARANQILSVKFRTT